MTFNRKFIESEHFPIEAIIEASAKEKGPGRPPFWEMLFWWTRKPLAGARAILLAAALDEEDVIKGGESPGKGINPGVREFLRSIYPSLDLVRSRPPQKWVFKKTPHRDNPKLPVKWREKVAKLRVLDPMAGFGNIPLEALRLGFGEVYAWDLLPIARLILKAVLEYPSKYGKELIRDVEKYGKKIIEELKNDPDIKELYDPDTAVYIGTWEVKCPYCGRYTPLIGNWWLARLKDSQGRYKALAWMEPYKENNTVRIRVRDLTSKLEKTRGKAMVTQTHVEINGEKYKLPNNGKPNIQARTTTAICLHCGGKIIQKIQDPETKQQTWYVKHAIRTWNKQLEEYLQGKITIEQLKQSLARPTIIVKVKIINNKVEFQEAIQEDNEKLWKALEKLRQIWGDPDIPTEQLPPYGSRGMGGDLKTVAWGLNKWYMHFNPRQLLILVKLAKLIREESKNVEEEKLRSGWSNQEALRYAEAITTYLSIALIRMADYNSVVTRLHPSNPHGIEVEETLSTRGITMTWNFGETSPFVTKVPTFQVQGSWVKSLLKEVNALSYLVTVIYDSPSRIMVKIHNATELSMSANEKFSIIVIDPPYFDDVPYVELSDLYYVWAKRALSDNDGLDLRPRFHKELFSDEFSGEIRTQWEVFAVDELGFNPGRLKYFGICDSRDSCLKVYREKFAREFVRISSLLEDDGLLLVYFAQSRPETWELLVESAWRSDLWVSAGFPLPTESLQSIVSRGKSSIFESIILVLRKGRSGELNLADKEEEIVDELGGFINRIYGAGHAGFTSYVMTYAKALGYLMRYKTVKRGGHVLTASDVVKEAARLTATAFAREGGGKPRSPEAVLYLLLKRVVTPVKGYRRIPSNSLIMLGYGTLDYGEAVKWGVVRNIGRPEKGADVSKRKEFVLLEPLEYSEAEFRRIVSTVPSVDGVWRPRNTLDVYRILAYYSFRPRSVFERVYMDLEKDYSFLVDDAVELAKALCPLGDDPDARASKRILEYLGISCGESRFGRGLEVWLR